MNKGLLVVIRLRENTPYIFFMRNRGKYLLEIILGPFSHIPYEQPGRQVKPEGNTKRKMQEKPAHIFS